jgi:hypothetical protein
MILAAALFAAPAPTHAQAASDCPEIEEGEAHPVELRIGDFVLRAQVRTEATGEDGTRVEGRLISCERDRVIGPAEADAEPDAAEAADVAGVATVLRLLRDFSVALDLGSRDADGCIRAGLDVKDSAGQRPTAGADRPLAVEICGLPQR